MKNIILIIFLVFVALPYLGNSKKFKTELKTSQSEEYFAAHNDVVSQAMEAFLSGGILAGNKVFEEAEPRLRELRGCSHLDCKHNDMCKQRIAHCPQGPNYCFGKNNLPRHCNYKCRC